MALPNGVPSHVTFGRVFARLDPKALGKWVAGWMAVACEGAGLKHIAIDGNALRSAPKRTFNGCLLLVSAWAAENPLILGQQAVADGSHEIAPIPELLRVLDLNGALVTIAAAGCQKEIARQIRDQGGDYLLAVKRNQPALHDAVYGVFDRACDADFAGLKSDGHEEVDDAHGRHEERYVTAIYDPEEWPDVAAVISVGSRR